MTNPIANIMKWMVLLMFANMVTGTDFVCILVLKYADSKSFAHFVVLGESKRFSSGIYSRKAGFTFSVPHGTPEGLELGLIRKTTHTTDG